MATGDKAWELDLGVAFDDASADIAMAKARRFEDRLQQMAATRQAGGSPFEAVEPTPPIFRNRPAAEAAFSESVAEPRPYRSPAPPVPFSEAAPLRRPAPVFSEGLQRPAPAAAPAFSESVPQEQQRALVRPLQVAAAAFSTAIETEQAAVRNRPVAPATFSTQAIQQALVKSGAPIGLEFSSPSPPPFATRAGRGVPGGVGDPFSPAPPSSGGTGGSGGDHGGHGGHGDGDGHDPSDEDEQKALLKSAKEASLALRALTEEIILATHAYDRYQHAEYDVNRRMGTGQGLAASGVTPEELREATKNITAEQTRATSARGTAIGVGSSQEYLDAVARAKLGSSTLSDFRLGARLDAQGHPVDPALLNRIRAEQPQILDEAARLEQGKGNTAKRDRINAQAEALAEQLEVELAVAHKALNIEKRVTAAREAVAAAVALDPDSPISQSARQHVSPEMLKSAQAEQVRIADEHARTASHKQTRDYFYDPEASLSQRFMAGIKGSAPGDTTRTKSPVGAQFLEGFFGKDSSLELALGQAAKFSLLYGGLYQAQSLVTQGFAAAAQGAAQYEEALVALNLATGDANTGNAELARSASEAGTALGYGPAAGVQAAAQAVGLYDLNSGSAYDKQAIAQQSVEVAGRIGRVSNQDIGDVQQQVAGVIRSFNQSPYDQSRIEDQLTVISRRTGRSQGDILNATAQLGTTAQTAGYDPAETMALVAQIATTTGQTANAVAGQLSQVLSRAGDPAVLQRLASVGINVQGTTLKEQIQQLSELSLDPNTRSHTVQAFGRSRSGQSFDILLNQLGRVNQLSAEARNTDPGTGAKTFGTVMESLSKQIQVIGGHLQSIANGLAALGFFDIIKLAVVAFGSLVEALDNMVQLVNLIPGPFKELIGWTLALIAAQKVAVLSKGVGGAILETISGTFAGSGIGKALLARGIGTGLVQGAAGQVAGQVAGRAVTQVEVAALRSGIATLGGVAAPAAGAGIAGLAASGAAGLTAMAAAAGPAILVAGALTGLYGVVQGIRTALSDNVQVASDSAKTAAFAAGTPAELRDAASRTQVAVQAAQSQQELSFKSFMSHGFEPWLERIGGDKSPNAVIESEGIAKIAALKKEADDLEKQKRDAVAVNPAAALNADAFSNLDSMNTALAALTASGYSASQQLVAVNQAFENLIKVGAKVPGAAAIIAPGSEGQFTASVKALSGKGIAGLQAREQSVVDQLDPGGLQRSVTFLDTLNPISANASGLSDWLFPSQKNTAAVRATSQKDVQALNELQSSGKLGKIQTAADANVKKILAGAKHDADGQIILNKTDMAGLNFASEGGVGKALKGLGGSDALVAQLGAKRRADLLDLLKSYGAAPATAETAAAYEQTTVKLAESQAATAGAIARDKTTGPTVLLNSMQDTRAKALAFLNEMPLDTPDEIKAFQTSYQSIMEDIDARTAAAMDADAAAKIGAIEAIAGSKKASFNPEDQLAALQVDMQAARDALALTVTDTTTPDAAAISGTLPIGPAAAAQLKRPDATRPELNAEQQRAEQDKLDAGAVRQAAIQRQDLYAKDQLGLAARDQPGLARAAYVAAQRETEAARVALKNKKGTAEFIRQKELAERAALTQSQDADLAEAQTVRTDLGVQDQLALKPSDRKGLAEAAYKAAQRDTAAARRDVKAGTVRAEVLRQKQLAERNALGQLLTEQQADKQIDFASKLDVDDPLASQKTALHAAAGQLALARKGIVDQREAQMAWNKANHDLIDAQIQLSQQTRDDYDRTNPLQVQQAELQGLQKQYKNATNADEKQKIANQIADKNSQIDLTASQQTIQQIDDNEQLGLISHQAAQAARIAEKGRLDAERVGMTKATTGYQANLDASTALAKSIKSASDQYSGQFNLRDIKLPTVYEIRRSLGTTGNDMNASMGSVTTNNVNINGADFAKVVKYLNSILGKTAQPVRGYSTRTVG